MIEIIILSLLLFTSGKICQNNNILLDNLKFSKHKKYVSISSQLPVTGGVFLLILLIFFNFQKLNVVEIILLIGIFSVGFFADIFKNFSPNLRILLQILFCITYIWFSDILILDTRIDLINEIFTNNKIISIIFTTFCMLVLLNGTNFIDGLNLSVSGYYITIFISIFYLYNHYGVNIDINYLSNIFKLLLAILIVNFLNKTQLGDGGAYLLAFVTGFFIIDFINLNKIASPYFAINLLWYPCLENLFSIIRKLATNIKVSNPDNLHLHHLIFLFFKKKKKKFSNNISGLVVILINSLIIFISSYFFYSTKTQILILSIAIIFYIISYYGLKKYLLIK